MPQLTVVATIDSWMDGIEGNRDLNKGNDTLLSLGELYFLGDKSSLGHPIANFDVSAIPGGATIDAAKLVRHVTSADSTAAGKTKRCTRPADWLEFQVTWNDYKLNTAWTEGGGDVDDTTPTPVAFTLPGATGTWEVTGMAGFVTDAIDNRSNIVSIIEEMDDEDPGVDEQISFKSSEHADSSDRWKLVVDYTSEIGVSWLQIHSRPRIIEPAVYAHT